MNHNLVETTESTLELSQNPPSLNRTRSAGRMFTPSPRSFGCSVTNPVKSLRRTTRLRATGRGFCEDESPAVGHDLFQLWNGRAYSGDVLSLEVGPCTHPEELPSKLLLPWSIATAATDEHLCGHGFPT